MSLSLATDIVTRLGPATVLLDCAALPDLACELGLLGCAVRDLGTGGRAAVGVLAWTGDADALARFAGVGTLVIGDAQGQRAAVEAMLFAHGWHRHPAGMVLAEAGAWQAAQMPPLVYYRRGAATGLLATGLPADAALARFAWAAAVVRSGDRVLVASDDADAGAAVIAALSRAGEVTAVAGGVAGLAAEAAASAQAVVIVAAAVDWPAALAAARRVLVTDGRAMLGWPAGEDAVVGSAIDDHFISDLSWWQGAAGAAIMSGDAPIEAGWRLATASVDPLEVPAAPWRHPAFAPDEAAGAVVDFAAAYDNPALYRTMVQLGERLGDAMKLARLAEIVATEARADSADRGAGVAVLGYRVLELRLTASVPAVMALIEDYLAATTASAAPHVRRWRLSLSFLAGRLAELTGARLAALRWYRAAAAADWASFSPLLATKAVAAAFFAGRIALADGDEAAAFAAFAQGLETALAAAAAPHHALIGDHARPVPFYLQEMAEVLDMGSQCANALANRGLLARDPGLFWRAVDVRRFGLASWASDLMRENARLRGG